MPAITFPSTGAEPAVVYPRRFRARTLCKRKCFYCIQRPIVWAYGSAFPFTFLGFANGKANLSLLAVPSTADPDIPFKAHASGIEGA